MSQATFRADSVSWSSGAPAAKGRMVLLDNRAIAGDNEAITSSAFEVKARHLHLELDIEDLFAETDVTTVVLPEAGSGAHTETWELTQAAVDGTASRKDRFLYLLPLKGSPLPQVEAGCASAVSVPPNPAPDALPKEAGLNPNQRGPQDYASSRQISVDVSNTLEIRPCAGRPLTILGSFLIVLWNWDAAVQADEGSLDLATGFTGGVQPFDGKDGRPYVGSAREAYLFVQDGRFSILGDDGRPTRMYMGEVVLHTQAVAFVRGQGQVPGRGDLEGDLGLTGDLDVALFPGSPFVNAKVDGLLRGLDVDGTHTDFGPAPQTVTSSPARLGFSPVVFAVLLPLALASWWLLHRRRRPTHRGEDLTETLTPREQRAQTQASLARRDLADGHLTRALRHATCAVRLAPAEASHRVLRIVVLREAGRQHPALLKEAEREQAKLNRDLTEAEERAWTHAEATELLCSLGRRDEALASLQQAAREDAGFVVRRLLEGGYRLLWDEPWVRALRGPPAAQVDPAFS